jgi:hypothetical protein
MTEREPLQDPDLLARLENGCLAKCWHDAEKSRSIDRQLRFHFVFLLDDFRARF